jgi:carbohydrate-selective porin OprB
LFGLMGSWTLFTDSAGITALGTQYGLPSSLGGSEKNIEAFYKFQITPSFSIQPDVQWIGTPSGSLDNALVGSLRFQIDF